MRTPRAELRLAPVLVLLAIAAGSASAAARPVAGDGNVIVVLRTPSLAERVAAAGGEADAAKERAWTNDAVAAQKRLVARLALHGVVIRPEYSFARVLDGFSAAIPAEAIPVVERDPDVAGVYPDRVAYPASASVGSGVGVSPASNVDAALARAGIDGRGVTVAVLDTGANGSVPGIDVVGGDPGARPAASPDDPALVEEHGTETAGLVRAVAPAASILPIRVAGWQPDGLGHWAIFARSDQVVAGLDRAVDPNGDGDANDAVRIALVALAEPFAGFADGPEATAVAGARSLGTLVVAPAGNDGPAGAFYGDISAPGGAPDALTVGAVDTRVDIARARVAVRVGLDSLLDGALPLTGATAPRRELDLQVAAPRGAPLLTHFFTPSGGSIVAGRAALVPAGAAPGAAAAHAAEAGASAVLLYGSRPTLPAGALDEPVSVPVVSLPPAVARAMRRQLDAGGHVSVVLGPAGDVANAGRGHVAAFSSSGLAFDGGVKPDVVAPGVRLVTSEAGGRQVILSGSSGAAAAAAGAAALVAQARPSLGPGALAGLLTATAQPIAGDPVTSQGAGIVDAGAALAGEAVASPPTLALGTRTGATFTLSNVTARTLRVALAAPHVFVAPAHATIPRGRSVLVHVRAAGAAPADGVVVASVEGGGSVRVPFAIARAPAGVSLIRSASLASSTFGRSDSRPALLTVDAGAVVRAGGVELRPLVRLDVELARSDGTPLGLLARLRDVLPGRYVFGLTGRGPSGQPLAPGRYVVTLLGYPVDGGSPSRRKLGFTLR